MHPPSPDRARGFSLAEPPAAFCADPHPWFDALRTHAPVHRPTPDSVLLTRHEDLLDASARRAARRSWPSTAPCTT